MNHTHNMLADENFWKAVKYLTELSEKTDLEKIQNDLSLNQTQLYSYLNFLKDVGMPLGIFETTKGKFLEVSFPQKQIDIKFNLFEWLCFQATFPTLSGLGDKPYFEEIRNKLTSLEEQNKEHDLFPAIEAFANKVKSYTPQIVAPDVSMSNEIISFLEEAILEKEVINLNLNNQTHSLKVFPRKIVFLDGKLNIVAEGIEDKCLTNISIENIHSAHDAQLDWTPMFSSLEIDDFIASIRAITENEVRIVLKVYSRERFNADIKHHHFGNQCMFTNPEGDHIWAASIEPSDDLYDWLSQLGSDIEILDPISLKKDLLKYCEEKLKKIA